MGKRWRWREGKGGGRRIDVMGEKNQTEKKVMKEDRRERWGDDGKRLRKNLERVLEVWKRRRKSF